MWRGPMRNSWPTSLFRMMAVLLCGLTGLVPILGQEAAGAPVAANAQTDGLVDDSTYISLATGEQYTWSESWAYDESSSTAESDGEVIALSSDTGAVLFSYFPVGIDKDKARDIILSTFEDSADGFLKVDRGAYDNVSYSLDRANLSGDELGIFTLFVERSNDIFVSLFLAPQNTFAAGLTDVQAQVRIDGAGVFEGIEPAGLQTALDDSAAASPVTPSVKSGEETSTPRRTPTEVTTEEDFPTEAVTDEDTPTEEATEEATREGATLGDQTAAPTSRSRQTTTKEDSSPTADTSSDAGDFADVGVISDGQYESPQFGSSVTWNNAWTIDTAADTPVASDTEEGTDLISLAHADRQGPDSLGSVYIRMFSVDGTDTPESIVKYWTSNSYLTEGAGKGSTVLLSDSTAQEGGVVLVSKLDNGVELVQYLSVFFLDRGKTAVIVEFYAMPDSVELALADAQDGIQIEGDSILTLFDGKQIMAEI